MMGPHRNPASLWTTKIHLGSMLSHKPQRSWCILIWIRITPGNGVLWRLPHRCNAFTLAFTTGNQKNTNWQLKRLEASSAAQDQSLKVYSSGSSGASRFFIPPPTLSLPCFSSTDSNNSYSKICPLGSGQQVSFPCGHGSEGETIWF